MKRAPADAFDVLSRILQPQGIKVVTTGTDEIGAYLAQRYGSTRMDVVERRWKRDLGGIADARVVVLGVPMDAGAGFERGAFKGPLGIRSQWLATQGLYAQMSARGVVDIGDVRVNPSVITDDLLNTATIQNIRAARGQTGTGLPVAPHSILHLALQLISKINPRARVLLLGGDHSLSWIPVRLRARARSGPTASIGVVHFDAHTDLLKERDGLCCSFATWAYWANDAIGRGGRLNQLGTRISGHTRAYWERTLDVRQFWSEDIAKRTSRDVVSQVVSNLRKANVQQVYISNDVDGTDPRWVAATGTMVRGGMTPHFVHDVIESLGQEFTVVGADVVELAPPLKWHVPGEPARSNQVSARYALAQIDAMLAAPNTLARFLSIPAPASEKQVWSLPPFAKTRSKRSR
jgi:agmatinase